MSSGTIIERGNPRDPEVRALLEASHAMMLALFDPQANHFLSVEALATPEISLIVARINSRTVGCGALARRDGYGEIKSLFVDPEVRRAGVAAALMARLEAEAVAQDLALLRLETGNLLEAAIALYTRCGFAVCGPFGDYPDHPQSVFMEKRLA